MGAGAFGRFAGFSRTTDPLNESAKLTLDRGRRNDADSLAIRAGPTARTSRVQTG
jgi:hypothetical protein